MEIAGRSSAGKHVAWGFVDALSGQWKQWRDRDGGVAEDGSKEASGRILSGEVVQVVDSI